MTISEVWAKYCAEITMLIIMFVTMFETAFAKKLWKKASEKMNADVRRKFNLVMGIGFSIANAIGLHFLIKMLFGLDFAIHYSIAGGVLAVLVYMVYEKIKDGATTDEVKSELTEMSGIVTNVIDVFSKSGLVDAGVDNVKDYVKDGLHIVEELLNSKAAETKTEKVNKIAKMFENVLADGTVTNEEKVQINEAIAKSGLTKEELAKNDMIAEYMRLINK